MREPMPLRRKVLVRRLIVKLVFKLVSTSLNLVGGSPVSLFRSPELKR
jgi:hypothetical protein